MIGLVGPCGDCAPRLDSFASCPFADGHWTESGRFPPKNLHPLRGIGLLPMRRRGGMGQNKKRRKTRPYTSEHCLNLNPRRLTLLRWIVRTTMALSQSGLSHDGHGHSSPPSLWVLATARNLPFFARSWRCRSQNWSVRELVSSLARLRNWVQLRRHPQEPGPNATLSLRDLGAVLEPQQPRSPVANQNGISSSGSLSMNSLWSTCDRHTSPSTERLSQCQNPPKPQPGLHDAVTNRQIADNLDPILRSLHPTRSCLGLTLVCHLPLEGPTPNICVRK